MIFYGDWVGPTSNTRFRTCMEMRTNGQDEFLGYVQVYFWVEATGSFGGTSLKTSWGSSATLRGAGNYAESDWINVGWVDYRSSVSKSGEAYYTGGSGTVYRSAASGSYAPEITISRPKPCESCTHVRVSDNKNSVSWVNKPENTKPYSEIYIERQVDGGVWSRVAIVDGSANSWSDTTTSANHRYCYRVDPHNPAGFSTAYATSLPTYNTPAAPSKVTVARKDATTVVVSIENGALTASALDLQCSSDAKTWVAVRTVTGECVTSVEDAPGGGTFYYRARNTRGSLASAWSGASNAVVTICPPAAPTLIAPVQGSVVEKTLETVTFSWLHNPIDGSAQTEAEVEYAINGGTATVKSVSDSSQSVSVANSFGVNSSIVWRVRTKGASDEFGPWSASRSFRVCQVPTVVITTPSVDGGAVTDVPVEITWSYSDASGSQVTANVSIRDAQGKELWARLVQGSASSVSVGADELLLANKASFEVVVAVTSSSSLSARAVRTFATNYVEPAKPEVEVVVDSSKGSVRLVVREGVAQEGESVAATKSLGLFRRNANGSLVSLMSDAASGAGAVDLYPPLDQDLSYIATAATENGLTSVQEIVVRVPSGGYVFFNFDAALGYSRVAKLAMDVEWSMQRERDCEVFETEGNEDPLVFYGAACRTEASVSGNVWLSEQAAPNGWWDEAASAPAFNDLAEDIGVKVVRFPRGEVLPASVTCEVGVSSANSLVASVSASVRKVRAHGLAI